MGEIRKLAGVGKLGPLGSGTVMGSMREMGRMRPMAGCNVGDIGDVAQRSQIVDKSFLTKEVAMFERRTGSASWKRFAANFCRYFIRVI